MSVTIELEPEIQQRLAEKAKQNGLQIETYVKILIEKDVNGYLGKKSQEKPFYETATREEWLAEFNRWVDSHKDKNYPVLPDEAYSRENIYEDRF